MTFIRLEVDTLVPRSSSAYAADKFIRFKHKKSAQVNQQRHKPKIER